MRTAAFVAATAGIQGANASYAEGAWLSTVVYSDPGDCKNRKTRPPHFPISMMTGDRVTTAGVATLNNIETASNKFLHLSHTPACDPTDAAALDATTAIEKVYKAATVDGVAAEAGTAALKFDECFDPPTVWANASATREEDVATVVAQCGIKSGANPYVGAMVKMTAMADCAMVDQKAGEVTPFILHTNSPLANKNACLPQQLAANDAASAWESHMAVATCESGSPPTWKTFPSLQDCLQGTNQSGSTGAVSIGSTSSFVLPLGFTGGNAEECLDATTKVQQAATSDVIAATGYYLACPKNASAYATSAQDSGTTCASTSVRSSAAAGLFAAAAWLLF